MPKRFVFDSWHISRILKALGDTFLDDNDVTEMLNTPHCLSLRIKPQGRFNMLRIYPEPDAESYLFLMDLGEMNADYYFNSFHTLRNLRLSDLKPTFEFAIHHELKGALTPDRK